MIHRRCTFTAQTTCFIETLEQTTMMNKVVLNLLLLVGVAHAAMTDPATGIAFAPKLDDRDIVGVGVRKKGPIKVCGESPSMRDMVVGIVSSYEYERSD